ncbi:MAG: hypothetical protein Fur006_08570 [Coleofasciculaceae cyanobacterium]
MKGTCTPTIVEQKFIIWTKGKDNASIIANNRVVFNIKGNSYRLIVAIRYDIGIIFIRFIGTHAKYDKVDAEIV